MIIYGTISGCIRRSLFNLWRCVFIANTKNDLPINEHIRVEELMVIGPNGEQMGLKKLNDALTIANFASLDLVLMSPGSDNQLPVAKIIDYNKYRYEKQKKQKEAQKRQREVLKEVKEYRLSATIDVHDFETRRRNAEGYLKKGHKIKATIKIKGRQMAHPELVREVLVRFADSLQEFANVEVAPKLDNRVMYMLLAPKK